MSNKKLTKELRETICGRVLKAAFATRLQTFATEEARIACDLYDEAIPAAHRALMAQLPESYFGASPGVTFHYFKRDAGGTERQVNLERPLRSLPDALAEKLPAHWRYRTSKTLCFNETRRMPNPALYSGLKLEGLDCAAVKAHESWLRRGAALEAEIAELERSVNCVLNSVTTVKRLLDAWPEVRPHLPDEALLDGERSLPTVIIADLNAKIEAAKGTFVAQPVTLEAGEVVTLMNAEAA